MRMESLQTILISIQILAPIATIIAVFVNLKAEVKFLSERIKKVEHLVDGNGSFVRVKECILMEGAVNKEIASVKRELVILRQDMDKRFDIINKKLNHD